MTPRIVLGLWLAAACTPRGDTGPAETDADADADTDADTDADADPATWSGDVHPVLTDSCMGCHQDAMPMALTGDPAADYDTVVPYTDVADPSGSTLYEAATGIAHAAVLAEGSAEAGALLSWMAAGARED